MRFDICEIATIAHSISLKSTYYGKINKIYSK